MIRHWHITMAAVILTPFALCAAEPELAFTLRLRQDAPSLNPEEAKALSPQALGDALLVPGHVPVTEVAVGPQGMEALPPPGAVVPTQIKLYLQPSLSDQSGFCKRIVATTYLQPVNGSEHASEFGGRPIGLTTEVAFRWIGEAHSVLACSGSKYTFFIPSWKGKQRVLEAVRLLAMASQAAKVSGRVRFPVSVEDTEGSDMLAYQRDHPEQSPIPGVQIIADGRKALASLPVGEVTFAGPSEDVIRDVIQASDLATIKRHIARGVIIFLGNDWTAGIVIVDGRIVRMRLRRAIPSPF